MIRPSERLGIFSFISLVVGGLAPLLGITDICPPGNAIISIGAFLAIGSSYIIKGIKGIKEKKLRD